MKKTAALWVLGLATLVGCKEVGPQIMLSGGTSSVDTSYLAAVESPQPHVIVIEEATGMHCVNCPGGAAVVTSIEQQYPGRVVAIGIHDGTNAEPFDFFPLDLRSDASRNLFSFFGGEPIGKPAATIDRVARNGDFYMLGTSEWAGRADELIGASVKANVQITSTWSNEDSTSKVHVRVAFIDPQTRPVYLTVGLTESGITGPQANSTSAEVDSFYTHNHALRDMLTLASGQLLSGNQPVEAGRVYERTFTYKPDAAWDPAHCEVFALVHYGDQQGKEVMQAAQAALK